MANYDNPYHVDNVYGHIVSVLKSLSPERGMVHLDIGCGFGHIADAIASDMGMEYVGADINIPGLESLKERGFRAEYVDLRDVDGAHAVIMNALAGKRIASISMIDTLEHLEFPGNVLTLAHRLAKDNGSVLVCSVPNATHRDIGAKLAVGRWDITQEGLLDRTHLQFFSEKNLIGLLRAHGFHQTAAHDVTMIRSDQYFPATHPLVSTDTVLGGLVNDLRCATGHAHTYQFVRGFLVGPVVTWNIPDHLADPPKKPFLSVVTRTQGKRLDTLREVLLCLSAQTDDDFEVLVVGHKLEEKNRLGVERAIEDVHTGLRGRIRLLRIEHGNRTVPLNFGFEQAEGEYVAILDDDDLVFANWVETFRELAKSSPGRVLRSVAVAQKFSRIGSGDESSVMASGSPEKLYPSRFDHIDHLYENQTPPVALAFPASAFKDAGIRFDESLTTTEDWDFLMRTASICGVTSSAAITCIYRQWNNAESSFTVHSKQEWVENHNRIWKKFDETPLLLDRGATLRIRAMQERLRQLTGENTGIFDGDAPDIGREMDRLRQEIHLNLSSRSWRITAPLRWIAVAFGASRIPEPPLKTLNKDDLHYLKHRIVSSRSWRLTAPLRRRK